MNEEWKRSQLGLAIDAAKPYSGEALTGAAVDGLIKRLYELWPKDEQKQLEALGGVDGGGISPQRRRRYLCGRSRAGSGGRGGE